MYKHQKRILKENPERTALVWETGTGKTIAGIKLADRHSSRTLVICPLGLKEKWRRDLEKYGTMKYHIMSKEEFRRDWEIIPKYDAVIVDEAHYFLGMKSQMSHSLRDYFKLWDTPARYLLTATAYRSTPWDVYVMMILLGYRPEYQRFSTLFFNLVPMGGRRILLPKANIEESLAEVVERLGDIVRLEECVDVPPQIYETEYFELTKQQEKAIKENFDPVAIVQYTKEHQICGGTLKEDYEDNKKFPTYKIDRLKELAFDNKRMIVVCRYVEELKILAEQFPGKAYILDGTMPAKNRQNLLDVLEKQEEYVLFVSAAICEGWELQNCRLMVFYSYDFSLKAYIQMQGRIRRINNLQKNVYLSLICKDTIDEEVYKNIVEKKMDFHVAIYDKTQSKD